MIQQALLKELAWRVGRLVVLCTFGALIIMSGCTATGAATVAMTQVQPEFGVEIGLLPQPISNQPLPTPGAVGELGLQTLTLLQQVARAAPCQLAWPILAGVATVEDSSYGATHAIGPAILLKTGQAIHAYGPAQMLIATFAVYGDHVDGPAVFVGSVEQPPVPNAHIWQPEFAYAAAARLLCSLHVDQDPVAALWAYSGCVPGPSCARSDRYPFQVLALAATFASADPGPPAVLAERVLREAFGWIGTKYVFGGTTRAGIDCSAFVQQVYAAVGITLPRTTQPQYNATIGRGMGVTTPAPGDIVFFRQTYFDPQQTITHVGIVTAVDFSTGAVRMIHAPGARAVGDPPDMPDGRVREETITGFFASKLAGYARVLPAAPPSNQA